MIAEDAASPAVTVAAHPGISFHRLWGTEGGVTVANTDDGPMPYWPGETGTRCIVVRWAPMHAVPQAPEPIEADFAELERLLPGLGGAFDPERPGFHTTQTIDYGMCLDGEVTLIVDDGQAVRITPGTLVVQRGTSHAWENRSDNDAAMLFVQIGTTDVNLL